MPESLGKGCVTNTKKVKVSLELRVEKRYKKVEERDENVPQHNYALVICIFLVFNGCCDLFSSLTSGEY